VIFSLSFSYSSLAANLADSEIFDVIYASAFVTLVIICYYYSTTSAIIFASTSANSAIIYSAFSSGSIIITKGELLDKLFFDFISDSKD